MTDRFSLESVEAWLEAQGYLVVLWHFDDVQEIRPDLTDAQCRKVLKRCKEKMDATIGIDWDILELYANDLFPPPQDSELVEDEMEVGDDRR